MLKYGIGIFAPVTPAGFDVALLEGPSDEPTLITLADGETADAPREIVLTGRMDVRIVMGRGSRARFIERRDGAFAKAGIELVLGDGASAEYVSNAVVEGGTTFIERTARLSKDASLRWVDLSSGDAFNRSSVTTLLEGPGASVRSLAASFGWGQGQTDSHQEVRHLAPHTTSDLRYRGVLAGSAKAIIRGLVRIPKGVTGCNGRQQEDVLLLSPKAEASTVPKLEIENNDVRCGHAATTGRLDEDKLFYLMSRGLDRPEAVRTMVEGFLAPVVEAAGDDRLIRTLLKNI
jgi:Fe-S cluster assembly protein SufD